MLTIEKVLAAVLTYPQVANRLREVVTSDLAIPNPLYRRIAEFVTDFYLKYRSLPKPGDYTVWAGTLEEPTRGGVLAALAEIQRQDISGYTPEYLAETAVSELQIVAARTAVARLSSLGADASPEALAMVSDRVSRLSSYEPPEVARISEVDRWLGVSLDEGPMIPTGLPTLDAHLGGWRKSELVFLMADSGIGKTSLMVNHGTAAALHGAKVQHYSMEVGLRPLMERYYRRIAESDRGELRSATAEVRARVKHWLRFAKGSLSLIYLDPYVWTSEDLSRTVDQVAELEGGVDMVIVDYLDLMAPLPKHQNRAEHQYLQYIAHEVRAVSRRYDVALLSPTQADRSAHGRPQLALSNMSAAYGKVRAADIVAALMQTEEEEEQNQARLRLLKVREGASRGREVGLYINLDLMLVADMSHPNTLRIMKQLGHLPE